MVPKEKIPEPISVEEASGSPSIPKTAISRVLSSVGSVSSGFLCQRTAKIKPTPTLTVSEQCELGCGKALVDKGAESHRGIVWLRLIRPGQAIKV